MVTKKYAKRIVNYIFDNWHKHYVLDKLRLINLTDPELREVLNRVDPTRDHRQETLNKCKPELLKIVLEKQFVIDPLS